MDPVSLVVGALAAGVNDTARQAVKDAYEGLKRLLSSRFAGKLTAEVALAEHEADPRTWRAPLKSALEQTGAGLDPAVVAAARTVMELVDPDGARSGKYDVDMRGAQGVQVGDRNQQINMFGASPATE